MLDKGLIPPGQTPVPPLSQRHFYASEPGYKNELQKSSWALCDVGLSGPLPRA